MERAQFQVSNYSPPRYQLIKSYKTPVFDNQAIFESLSHRLNKCKSIFLLPVSVSPTEEIYEDEGYEPIGEIITELDLSFSERLDIVLSIICAVETLERSGLQFLSLSKGSVYIQPLTQAIMLFDYHRLQLAENNFEESYPSAVLSESVADIVSLILTTGFADGENASLMDQHPQVFDAVELLRCGKYQSLHIFRRDFERITQYMAVLGLCPRFDLNAFDDEGKEKEVFYFNHGSAIHLNNVLSNELKKSGGCYVVKGKAGVGKSTLIRKIISSQSESYLYVNHSAVDLEPYSSLDKVLGQCIDKFIGFLGEKRVRQDLAYYSEQLSLVSDYVSTITGKKREISDHDQLNTGKLIQELYALTKVFLKEKLIVHFDDASHLDSHSYDLLKSVSRLETTNLFLILEDNTEYSVNSAYDYSLPGDFKVIELAGFTENDTKNYLAKLLNAQGRDLSGLAPAIHSSSEGIPDRINSLVERLARDKILHKTVHGYSWRADLVEGYFRHHINEPDHNPLPDLTDHEKRCLSFICKINQPIFKDTLTYILGIKSEEFTDVLKNLFEFKYLKNNRCNQILILDSARIFISKHEQFYKNVDNHYIVSNIISILLRTNDHKQYMTMLDFLSKMGAEDVKLCASTIDDVCKSRIYMVVGNYCFNKKDWSLALSFFYAALGDDKYHTVPQNYVAYALNKCVLLARILGDIDTAERCFNTLRTFGGVHELASSSIDLIVLYKSEGKYTECVELGIEMLRLLGVKVPGKIGYQHIVYVFLLSKYLLSREDDLVSIEKNTSKEVELKTQILIEICIACYNASSEDENVRYELMMPYFALKCLIISLRAGYTAHSSHALVAYGLLCHMLQGNIDAAYKYYDIGKKVRDRFSDKEQKDLGLEFYFHGMIQPWREPLASAITALEKVKAAAFYSGQREFAGYLSGAYFALRITSGDNYQTILDALNKEIPRIAKLKHQTAEYIHDIYREHLTDVSSHGEISEYESIDLLRRRYGSNASVLFAALGSRMATHYYAGNYDVASRYFREANKRANTGGRGLPYLGFFRMLGSLNELERAKQSQRSLLRSPYSAAYVLLSCLWLGLWALKEKKVFRSKILLVLAEFTNTRKIPRFVTKALFEKANFYAQADNLPFESHISHELFARFLQENGQPNEALAHLSEAYDGYSDQGILVKCKELSSAIEVLKRREAKGSESQLYAALANSFNSSELSAITEDISGFVLQCFKPDRVVIGINTGHVIRVCGEYKNGEYRFLNTDYLNYRQISRPLVSLVMGNGGVVYVSDTTNDHILAEDPYSYGLGGNVAAFHFVSSDRIQGFVYLEGVRDNINYLSEDNLLLRGLRTRVRAALDGFQSNKERDKALREANLVKQRDNNLSHEIRTPLNGIANLSRLCISQSLDRETLNSYLSMINNEAEEVSYLVDDILTAKNIDEGNIVLKNETMNVAKTFESVIRWFEINKQNDFVVLERPDYSLLPELIIADQTKIKQILRNLLNNAFKFTRKGNVTVGLDAITSQDEQLHMLLKVKDSGSGIRQDQLAKVFDKGYQAQSIDTQGYRGNGIGLWLVRSFARKMGGDARLVSKPGIGTEVFVTFKAMRAKDVPDETIEIFPDTSVTEGKKVLVAEDHSANQEVMKSLLLLNGVNPIVVDDGLEAVQACSKFRFDLIILDLNMPVMDGYTACKEIRNHGLNKHAPIVAISAHSDSVIVKTKEQGFDDYLSKPINEKVFNNRISRWISTSVNVNKDDPALLLDGLRLQHLKTSVVGERITNSPISFTINLQCFEENYHQRVLEMARDYPDIGNEKVIELFHQLASHATCLGLDELAKLSRLCEEKMEEGADIQQEVLSVRLEMQRSLEDVRLILARYKERNELKECVAEAGTDQIKEFRELLKKRSMKANIMLGGVKKRLEKIDRECAVRIERMIIEGDYVEAEKLLGKIIN